MGGVGGGQAVPGGQVGEFPEDGVEDEALVQRGAAAGGCSRGLEEGLDEGPLLIGEVEGGEGWGHADNGFEKRI
jgi:hypothetical protein